MFEINAVISAQLTHLHTKNKMCEAWNEYSKTEKFITTASKRLRILFTFFNAIARASNSLFFPVYLSSFFSHFSCEKWFVRVEIRSIFAYFVRFDFIITTIVVRHGSQANAWLWIQINRMENDQIKIELFHTACCKLSTSRTSYTWYCLQEVD